MTAAAPAVAWRGRPGDGPVAERGDVTGADLLGAYVRLRIAAAEVAARSRPGQFVEVAVEAPATLLRRPFSVAGVAGGSVEIVVDPHGPGTAWLADRRVGSSLDLVGPLGVGFPAARPGESVLLVGGGYGVAPLVWFAQTVEDAGGRAHLLSGAASAERLFVVADGLARTVTTDDGSAGRRGLVTDPLADVAARVGADRVVACGPMPMLRAVARGTADLGLRCDVAVEEHMACGVGVCWTCVVPVRGRDGEVRNRRACLDGPVFDAHDVAWEATRWGGA